MNINFFIKNKIISIIFLFAFLSIIFIFDKGLSIGLFLLFILSFISFYVFKKFGINNKKVYALFIIALSIHLSAMLFMYYTDFQPFSGHLGDYITYQKSAVEFSEGFRQGDFSTKSLLLKYPDLYVGHCYPAIIGAVYALTIPEEIIGLILNVWLVVVSIIFIYLIVLEIGGSDKNAFIVGIISAIYPSYIFNTGLLLKDAFEIFFVMLALLIMIKIVKNFSWLNFLIFYLSVICVTHFRFYIGYALIITFLLSWFLLSKIKLKNKLLYGILFIIILGFIPQISLNLGYYGFESFKMYLNPKMVGFYRQTVYNPDHYTNTDQGSDSSINSDSIVGLNSSFKVDNGSFGYLESFFYVLLGPLPWQVRNLNQSLALLETIPWYLLLFFIVDGVIISVKNRIKEIFPLIIFSIIVMVVIAIFDTNFGLIVRIRIPAFISLLCIASIAFNKDNIIYNYLEKKYEKIFSYWRSWFYRFQHS